MKNKKLEVLKSRERVIRAVNHEPVDRMPIDLGMHSSTRISAFAYWNLREYLDLPSSDIEIIDMVQFTARVHEDVLKRFHCDCIALHPGWGESVTWYPRGRYHFEVPRVALPVCQSDGSWLVQNCRGSMKMPLDGYFFSGDWLKVDDRPEDLVLELTAREAERIFHETDFYTCYNGFHGYFSENLEWQCRMLTEPEIIAVEQQSALEYNLRQVSRVIDKMGGYIQSICVGNDLGMQNGPAVRPSLYEELCAPYLERFCRFIHQNSDCKVFMHSCGSIKPFIPMLIECGVDILNPVQISAANMDAAALKKEFGQKITFWGGGCDTQHVLGIGTPANVADNVRCLVETFKPGSGFVFNQVHNIMGNVPPENIVAMLDTAYENSFYI